MSENGLENGGGEQGKEHNVENTDAAFWRKILLFCFLQRVSIYVFVGDGGEVCSFENLTYIGGKWNTSLCLSSIRPGKKQPDVTFPL